MMLLAEQMIFPFSYVVESRALAVIPACGENDERRKDDERGVLFVDDCCVVVSRTGDTYASRCTNPVGSDTCTAGFA